MPDQESDDISPVIYTRHPRARYYRITIQKDGSVRVTIPARGSERGAREFVEQQKDWIRKARLRQKSKPRAPSEWMLGNSILWRGEWTSITENTSSEKPGVVLGTEHFRVPSLEGNLRPALENAFLRRAKIELPARAWALAASTGAALKSISIRNQRTRWGSCSHTGRVSLNWRLVQTPDFVRDYIICHELAHLKHMNHSVRFWKEVDTIFPRWREAERWLKKHNTLLGL